jgi:hypothetical protein
LNSNADIMFQRKETSAVMDTVVAIQPRIGLTGSDKTPEDIVNEMIAGTCSRQTGSKQRVTTDGSV